ncbi:hypothetical protein AX17_004285 [Amanita inopinata Kibby_2008]|nr:hypothetical protein AX17_004285 [Amanita inopinata Kibby_2008]
MKLRRTSLNGQVSPIHHLPPEVIALVFKHCLPKPGDFEKHPNDVAPLLLGRICSSWRALAHSTPELWNMFNLNIDSNEKDVQTITGFMTTWLEKSGKLPLTISLQLGRRASKTIFNSISECLYRYSSRWEILDMEFMKMQCTSLPSMGDLPLLRSIRYEDWHAEHFDLPFASAPCLTRLNWTHGHRVVKHPGIPWHKLTHLRFHRGITLYDAIEAIHSCPQLLDFSASVIGDEMERTMSLTGRQVKLHKLHRLFVNVNLDCSPLWHSLTLPELVDFTLVINQGPRQWPEDSTVRRIHRGLLQLFTRSKCKLDKVYLDECGFDENMTLECFRHNSLSTLTELQFHGWFNSLMPTDKVILELTLTEDIQDRLLPNLSRIGLSYEGDISPGLLGRMILSRRRLLDEGPGQLKSVSLVITSLDGDDKTYIDMACNLGLEVDVDTLVNMRV